MIIGIDASGSFAARTDRHELRCSAVAAAAVPAAARREIAEWTESKLIEWQRDGLEELHAQEMSWNQRTEVCRMLCERRDVHVAVCWTSDLLLRGPEAISRHRKRQLNTSEGALTRTTSSAGRSRGELVCRLLAGRRFRQGRLSDSDYVRVAMTPLAVMGAVQRAVCFYAEEGWRDEMTGFELVMDEDTPSSIRYLNEMLLPVVSGDPRFQIITPDHWCADPVHPLLAAVRHPDGDGYLAKGLLARIIHEETAPRVIQGAVSSA